jgi:hypothetical protein
MSEKEDPKLVKFHLRHRLEELYHGLFDELANTNLRERDISNLAQLLLLSKQEGLKPFLDHDEEAEYLALYPGDQA